MSRVLSFILLTLFSILAAANSFATENNYGEFVEARYEDLYHKDSCARHTSYVHFYSKEEDGSDWSVSAGSYPGFQAQVDASYARLLGSDEGKKIIQNVFYCSPTLMHYHLGISPGKAERLVKGACGKIQNLKTDDIILAYQNQLSDYFLSPQGRALIKNQFACEKYRIANWISNPAITNIVFNAACNKSAIADQTCDAEKQQSIDISGNLISAIAGFDPSATRSFLGTTMPRCISVQRVGKGFPYASFTERERNVTRIFLDDNGKISDEKLDHDLLHEFGVVADAKGFMHFPAFFIATGTRPEGFSPSAEKVSVTISDPIIHETLSGMREKNLESRLLLKLDSTPNYSKMSHEELQKENTACINRISERSRSGGNASMAFTGNGSTFDGHESHEVDLHSTNYTMEQLQTNLAALRDESVTIDGKKIPLCVWMEVPEISGSNYLGNFGPKFSDPPPTGSGGGGGNLFDPPTGSGGGGGN